MTPRKKKAQSSGRRPASAGKGAPASVADYLSGLPAPARRALKQMRAAIRSVVPRAATEVISYKMPAFTHDGVIVWYAAFADHVSLFPRAGIIDTFKDDLRGFKTSKGTIQFSLDQPLPIPLIKRIVKARVVQHASRKHT